MTAVRSRRTLLIAALAALVAVLTLSAQAHARPTATQQCPDPYPAQQIAGNPLLLSSSPGANPLGSVSDFFVDGPAHGAAAGAIAQLLGHSPSSYPATETWAQFEQDVNRQLPEHPSVAGQVRALEKIASGPEVQRLSPTSQGGGYTGLYSQTQKLFCHNFIADPGTVPIINIYFLHGLYGSCPSSQQIAAKLPEFEQLVNAVHDSIGNRPVLLLLETDAIGSSSCMSKHHSLTAWLAAFRSEIDKLSTLPHAVIYAEAGYSDANSPSYTAKALNQIDMPRIRGFYTNDTHLAWTINEVKWGERVSALTKGHPHFIINTAQNGNGPLVPRNRVKNGNEEVCNPPGRALGPKPTTSTGFPLVDAFLWTSIPGNSSGTCNGGPNAGTFWSARAIQLAEAANNRLGPGSPSQPY
jgi:endoglucanase